MSSDSKPTDLEASILKTLCWFAVFSYPITAFEIWRWLMEPSRPYEVFDVTEALDRSVWLTKRIERANGFYALRRENGIENQIRARHERHVDGIRKFRKLRRVAHYFRLFHSVRMLSAANSLAFWNTTPKSDIDMLIVTRPNTIWSSRLFLVFPFVFLRQRPMVTDQDPLCFSFFLTQEAFKMESLQCFSRDVYLAFWTRVLRPIFDKDENRESFARANRWSERIFPNATLSSIHSLHEPRSFPSLIRFPVLFETIARWFQVHRFPQPIRELANQDSRVVVSNTMLKFHANDRRAEFLKQFEDVCEVSFAAKH